MLGRGRSRSARKRHYCDYFFARFWNRHCKMGHDNLRQGIMEMLS